MGIREVGAEVLYKASQSFAPMAAKGSFICFPARHVRAGKHFSACQCAQRVHSKPQYILEKACLFHRRKHKNPPEFLPAGPCSYEKEENEGVEEDWYAPMKVGGRQVELLAVSRGSVDSWIVAIPLPCVHYNAKKWKNLCLLLAKFDKWISVLILVLQ